MTNRAGHDGSDFETGVRVYLAERAGIEVRREVKHGSADQGDLHATVHGLKTVVECKRVERVTPKLLADYRLQTETERRNAGAELGILVTWRKGKGFRYDEKPTGQRAKSFGENVAHMTVGTLMRVASVAGEVEAPGYALDAWVSMDLATLALLARDWEAS